MTTLLSLLTGPNTIFAALFGAIVLAVVSYVRGRVSGAKLERNANRAKDADAYEKSLKDLAAAADARPVGSVSDDPRNRDTR